MVSTEQGQTGGNRMKNIVFTSMLRSKSLLILKLSVHNIGFTGAQTRISEMSGKYASLSSTRQATNNVITFNSLKENA